jgi:hypothetical protein
MKKAMKILSVFILSIFMFSAIAQKNNDEKIFRNAISVNLTTPLIQAINRNKIDSGTVRIATNIAYNRIIGTSWLMRLGVGGYNNYQDISSDIFSDRKIENTNRLSALLSIFKLTSINENWLFGFGGSLSGIYTNVEKLNDSGFDIVNSYQYSQGGGIGPAVLFQYNLNKRLSLFSEYSILYNRYETAEGKVFSSYPDQNYAKLKLSNQGIQFQFPLAIYVNYQF